MRTMGMTTDTDTDTTTDMTTAIAIVTVIVTAMDTIMDMMTAIPMRVMGMLILITLTITRICMVSTCTSSQTR